MPRQELSGRGDPTQVRFLFHVMEFVCSANQHPKSTGKKKSPQTFVHLDLPCLIIIQSSYFDCSHALVACAASELNPGIVRMQRRLIISLRDLFFVLCSRDLDILRAQRIIGFFILITHKSTWSENPMTWFAGYFIGPRVYVTWMWLGLGLEVRRTVEWFLSRESSRWLEWKRITQNIRTFDGTEKTMSCSVIIDRMKNMASVN